MLPTSLLLLHPLTALILLFSTLLHIYRILECPVARIQNELFYMILCSAGYISYKCGYGGQFRLEVSLVVFLLAACLYSLLLNY
jgi:hypothetical protein